MGSRGILKRENGAFTPSRCQKNRDGQRGNEAKQLRVPPEPRAGRWNPLLISLACSSAQRRATSTPPCPTLLVLVHTKAFCLPRFSWFFSKENEAQGLSAINPARWDGVVEVSHTPNQTVGDRLGANQRWCIFRMKGNAAMRAARAGCCGHSLRV